MTSKSSKLFALGLFAFTVAAVVFYPAHQSTATITPTIIMPPVVNVINEQKPKVELVFVLDTTGSMSGLIDAAKEKIWSIATTMASAQPAPEISIGLVAFRDRGDAYVTQVTNLSTDLDSVYATLMDFKADGGGDGPESVNKALYDAVNAVSWSQSQDVYKVAFLVGDAPPHMDYQDDIKYPDTLRVAQSKGIIVNAVQAGNSGVTTNEWQLIAQLGAGDYFQVDQGGSALAVVSPFDRELAELSAKLDDTRLYYGDEAELVEKNRKVEATKKINEAASLASRARRAVFNASASGEKNLLGGNELVDDVSSGRVDLDSIDRSKLPEPMLSMAPAEQASLIKDVAENRKELKEKIKVLSDERSAYLKKQVEEMGSAKDDSLDMKLFGTLKTQAKSKGMVYESDAPDY
ncbi:VWA domain-containing protein [Pseudomonadota bacterium]